MSAKTLTNWHAGLALDDEGEPDGTGDVGVLASRDGRAVVVATVYGESGDARRYAEAFVTAQSKRRPGPPAAIGVLLAVLVAGLVTMIGMNRSCYAGLLGIVAGIVVCWFTESLGWNRD